MLWCIDLEVSGETHLLVTACMRLLAPCETGTDLGLESKGDARE